jgi:hypothetical protein
MYLRRLRPRLFLCLRFLRRLRLRLLLCLLLVRRLRIRLVLCLPLLRPQRLRLLRLVPWLLCALLPASSDECQCSGADCKAGQFLHRRTPWACS